MIRIGKSKYKFPKEQVIGRGRWNLASMPLKLAKTS